MTAAAVPAAASRLPACARAVARGSGDGRAADPIIRPRWITHTHGTRHQLTNIDSRTTIADAMHVRGGVAPAPSSISTLGISHTTLDMRQADSSSSSVHTRALPRTQKLHTSPTPRPLRQVELTGHPLPRRGCVCRVEPPIDVVW